MYDKGRLHKGRTHSAKNQLRNLIAQIEWRKGEPQKDPKPKPKPKSSNTRHHCSGKSQRHLEEYALSKALGNGGFYDRSEDALDDYLG